MQPRCFGLLVYPEPYKVPPRKAVRTQSVQSTLAIIEVVVRIPLRKRH